MRTKKKVDLKRLAAALPDYPFAYLITVDDGYRVHTVTVEPTLRAYRKVPTGPAPLSMSGPSAGTPGRTSPTAARSPCCGLRASRAATR